MARQGIHSQLFDLASATSALIANRETPRLVRRKLRTLAKDLRKELPKAALREIEAARAGATIKASDYLRRAGDS